MVSTFHSIETAKKSLIAHQAALNTVGHNLVNVNNKEYSRQVVDFSATEPIYLEGITSPNVAGYIGTGTKVQQIKSVKDVLLESRFIDSKSKSSYWDTNFFYLKQIEAVSVTDTASNLEKYFNRFVNAWNDVANSPSEKGHREVLVHSASDLVKNINELSGRYSKIKQNILKDISIQVDNYNSFSKKIASLNKEIASAVNAGNNPNDLIDKRDAMLNKLADIVDISKNYDNSDFMLYLSGDTAIQGDKFNSLRFETNKYTGKFFIKWDKYNKNAVIKHGKLAGLSNSAKEAEYQIGQLDNFVASLVDVVNTLHREGIGLNGKSGKDFFIYNKESFNYVDFDSDGIDDRTKINKIIGSKYLEYDLPVSSTGKLKLSSGNKTVKIDYFSTDTVRDIINRVNNSKADVRLKLHNNKLVVSSIYMDSGRSGSELSINHLEDSGDFLVNFSGVLGKSGSEYAFKSFIEGSEGNLSTSNYYNSFTSNISSNIQVNPEIVNNMGLIAAAKSYSNTSTGDNDMSFGNNDGVNALRIVNALTDSTADMADFKNDSSSYINYGSSFIESIHYSVQDIASKTKNSLQEYNKGMAILSGIENNIKSVSSVSIDEELSNMMMYSHGYNASAKFIKSINDTLNMLVQSL